MSFSQGWDTGFRVILIYVGIVFVWLGLIEPYFTSRSVSVIVMNIVAFAISAAFVVRARNRFIAERRQAEADVAALMQEDL
ncbi:MULTISPECIES: hypothetical protein [Sinorhizobium]|jgi:Ca2+/H+ antiporter|uniref:hypothetical protein n=1 Tax=Sinorhizobium TaxID=28105 RepID=UPI0003648759|nr:MULTISPECIES: hypothetical protein [Sinorhizobium]PND23245.1 hypothetical protein CN934_00270 [Ensifer sp. MMN_5]PND28554.1 hypothetical protein CN933_00275 [Sinorhizobium sp. M4_45]